MKSSWPMRNVLILLVWPPKTDPSPMRGYWKKEGLKTWQERNIQLKI